MRSSVFLFGVAMLEKDIIENGLYIVSDQYFVDFPSDRFMQNKGEARPNYFAVKDKDGVFWMLPLSSKVEKYKAKIAEAEKRYGVGNYLYCEIIRIASKDRAVLIGNMFPVSASYVLRPYQISGIDYIVKNKNDIKRIRQKTMRYLNMIQRGVLPDAIGVMAIKKKLLETT